MFKKINKTVCARDNVENEQEVYESGRVKPSAAPKAKNQEDGKMTMEQS